MDKRIKRKEKRIKRKEKRIQNKEKRGKNKEKRTNNDPQNTTQKKTSNTNPTETGSELRCPGSVSSSCSTNGTRRVNLVTNPVISHE